MDLNTNKINVDRLMLEMQQLGVIINTRMNLYWNRQTDYADITDVPMPNDTDSFFGQVVNHYQVSLHERIILLLALAPHIMPSVLDVFFTKNATYDKAFTEFGGAKGLAHSGFLPTGETAAFIIAGNELQQRLELLAIFGEDHFFKKSNILKLVHAHSGEPYLSGTIVLTNEYLSYLTLGKEHRPDFGINFPAKRLETGLEWSDLVLADNTLEAVEEIRDWLQHGPTLLNDWGLINKIKPGYKTLFYGPPGTGKTLTASLLGKSNGLDVYRIDLSMVVSKFIGETEKNLSNVFDQAEDKNWILFFDEADSLFGKRTQTSSSNDRYANQEVSYLLQRIEDFPGVVILATNLKANLDDAFSRRFQSMIYFELPNAQQRFQLWQNGFSDKTQFEENTDLRSIAEKYELSGGSITNVVRYASLQALKRGNTNILQQDIIVGIRKEFGKEGKTVM